LQSGLTGWRLWLPELLAVGVGPFITAVVLVGCRALPAVAAWPLTVLDDSLYLTLLWLLCRIGLWLLALAAGRGSWLGRRELVFTWLAWVVGLASFIGLLEVLESTLDTIDLIPGKGVFSLWSLLKGLAVVALFLAITSIVSRAIEQRVMRIADADAEEEGERNGAAGHLHMLPVITVEARGVYFYPPLACVFEALSY
jgi:hypothetical protein